MNKEILEEVIKECLTKWERVAHVNVGNKDPLSHGLAESILSDERLSKPILSSVAHFEDWISVDDSLPLDEPKTDSYYEKVLILVFNEKGRVEIGEFLWHKQWNVPKTYFFHYNKPLTKGKITHWMPLPQPPTDKETELMIQLYEKECFNCETIIEYSYERGVYDNHIHCINCDTYIELEDSENVPTDKES